MKRPIDLTEIDGFTYSSIMRKLRQHDDAGAVLFFQKIFKKIFDAAVLSRRDLESNEILLKAMRIFSALYPVKIDKQFIKSASAIELGNPEVAARYLSDFLKFLLQRIPSEQRRVALNNLSAKIRNINESELANKNIPDSASIGQAITIVKNMLIDHDAQYIRSVLNNIAKDLLGG